MGLFDSLGEDLRRLECRPVILPWPVVIDDEKWQLELKLPPFDDRSWSDALIAAKVTPRTAMEASMLIDRSRLAALKAELEARGKDEESADKANSFAALASLEDLMARHYRAFALQEGLELQARDHRRVVLTRADCQALCANGAGPPPIAAVPAAAQLLPPAGSHQEPRPVSREQLAALFAWSERVVELPTGRRELRPVALLRFLLACALDDDAYYEALEKEKKAPTTEAGGAGSPPANSTPMSATPSKKRQRSASAGRAVRSGKRTTAGHARKGGGTARKAPSS